MLVNVYLLNIIIYVKNNEINKSIFEKYWISFEKMKSSENQLFIFYNNSSRLNLSKHIQTSLLLLLMSFLLTNYFQSIFW